MNVQEDEKTKKLKVATKALAILDKKLLTKQEEFKTTTAQNSDKIKGEIQNIESKKKLIESRVKHLQE